MAHAEAHSGHHVTPKKLLIKIFLALVALTIITVITAQFDFGMFNVPLALAIATTKAALVVLFFMALKYDNKVNSLVFSVGVIFVVIFLVFTLFDTHWRGDLDNVDQQTIMDQMRGQDVQRGSAAVGTLSEEDETAHEPIEDEPVQGEEFAPADTESDDEQGDRADTTSNEYTE